MLSSREAAICARIVTGYSNEAIALDLGISFHSVRTYRRRAYEKLNVTSQNELFAQILNAGIRGTMPHQDQQQSQSPLRAADWDAMIEAYICDAVRTPIGRLGGALSSVRNGRPRNLPIAALLRRNPQVDPREVDDVFLGCANQAGEDNRNIARMARCWPVCLSARRVDDQSPLRQRRRRRRDSRACCYCRTDRPGHRGGVESMTRAPYIMAKGDKPFSRTMQLEDTVVGWRLVNPKMQALYHTASMPETGENVAERYHVTRDEQDIYALQSQKRAVEAQANGYFAEEIEPVRICGKKQDTFVTIDEHPRPETTLDALKACARSCVRRGQ